MSEAELNNNQEILRQLENPEFLMDLRQQMLKFTVLQLSSFQQAEDVVQEALVSALQHLDSFSGRAAFKTWVFAILKIRSLI
jgi:RNA polymerase sigma-70 factor (ECF subfamily)